MSPGTGTITATLSFAIALIQQNPNVLERYSFIHRAGETMRLSLSLPRLMNEIREVLGDQTFVTAEDLDKLKLY